MLLAIYKNISMSSQFSAPQDSKMEDAQAEPSEAGPTDSGTTADSLICQQDVDTEICVYIYTYI